MSLHSGGCPSSAADGSATLSFAAPVFKSKIFRAVGVLPVGMARPAQPMSVEQTNSAFDLSSASTPRAEDNPPAPCSIQPDASAAPGSPRKMRPPAMLLKYSVPSADAVMLSGKSVIPGTVTVAGGAAEPAGHRPATPGDKNGRPKCLTKNAHCFHPISLSPAPQRCISTYIAHGGSCRESPSINLHQTAPRLASRVRLNTYSLDRAPPGAAPRGA